MACGGEKGLGFFIWGGNFWLLFIAGDLLVFLLK
jgi:hypothetical protein